MRADENYFCGIYYKFVSLSGYCFAFIDSCSNEGNAKQIILPDKAFTNINPDSIIVCGNRVIFNVHEKGLDIVGEIHMIGLHPLKSNVMGPFKRLPMECKHEIYSMYHYLKGKLLINSIEYDFTNGYGYMEGDEGRSFPSKYFWYNSISTDYGVTVAVATIPFGFFKFTGLLCFVSFKGKEYKICTYNFGRIKHIDNSKVIVSKGKYMLEINLSNKEGYSLKAPDVGNMTRLIKENVSVSTSFAFKHKKKILLEKEDECSSFEFMM